MITREIIEERLALLKADMEKLKSSIHATEGAIIDCEYWLSIVDAEEQVKEGHVESE